MHFNAYSNYKNSGVEWLGEVPEHWTNNKFKHVFFEKQHTQNMELPFGAISFGKVVFKEDRANLTEELKANYQEVLQGEFLINPLNLNYDLKSLRTALSKIDVVVSSGYIVLDTKDDSNSKAYLEYLLYIFDIFHMKSMGAGIRQTINFKDIGQSEVVLPNIDEQNQIAEFLDNETAKIDNLIAKQEQLIVLLEEQRKSVISHAVTKGLDPNAPMKNSGVEWLGEVPKHWDIASYKQICKIYRGKFTHRPRNDPSLYDGIYPFIQTGDIAKNKHLISSYSQTLNEKGKAVSQLFPKGTLIMAIAANIGDVSILGFDAYAPDSIIGFAPKDNLLLDFLRYSFKASLPALEQVSTKNTQSNLNIDRVGSVKTTLPPLEEQQKIIDFIETENSKIDNLIQKQQQLINQLKEYRTSVISHAVTGKIKVTQ